MNNTRQRPEWEIDRVLHSLVGDNIRVAAESFSPVRWDGSLLPQMIPCATLLLPDNSQPDGLPVLFEGKLTGFERRVGVIHVALDAPELPHTPAQGLVYFRGRSAVILSGPATVRLSSSLRIERLPSCQKHLPLADIHRMTGHDGQRFAQSDVICKF